jgi:hypothetical protein
METPMYSTHDPSPKAIAQARAWIDDCDWDDLESAQLLSPSEVVDGIERNYAGGWEEFLADESAWQGPSDDAIDGYLCSVYVGDDND